LGRELKFSKNMTSNIEDRFFSRPPLLQLHPVWEYPELKELASSCNEFSWLTRNSGAFKLCYGI